MKLQVCQFNHYSGETKLLQKDFFLPDFFIYQPFILNHIFRNEKEKRYFIHLKTNILFF